MPQNALRLLKERGFIEWCSHPESLEELFGQEMVTAYIGFDPTADSLHVGHLIPIMGLAWLQRLGHRPIAIAGGGTGLIGDPSGKSAERNLLTLEKVEENVEAVGRQLASFLDFDCGSNSALLVNNYDWLSKLNFIEFLRDIGKYFTINYMVSKEYVKSRLDDPEKSISFTEFSYTLLQAYDFYHLYGHMDCKLQMGGNDQQGNIVSGVDLIRKKTGKEAYGATYPLLLDSAGNKFGKTAGGAVWLAPERTSPYRFYQFWINSEDSQIEKLLRLYTFLPLDEVTSIMEAHREHPEKRGAQRRLAWEITSTVHGEHSAAMAKRASEILFGGAFEPSELTDEMLHILEGEVPFEVLARGDVETVADVLAASGACKSKGEARRLIRGGGVSVNGAKVEEETASVLDKNLLFDGYLFLKVGKKRFHLVRMER